MVLLFGNARKIVTSAIVGSALAFAGIFAPTAQANECLGSAAEVRAVHGVLAWSGYHTVNGRRCYYFDHMKPGGSTAVRSRTAVVAATTRREVMSENRQQIDRAPSTGQLPIMPSTAIRYPNNDVADDLLPSESRRAGDSQPPQRIIDLLTEMGWVDYQVRLSRLVDIARERWIKEATR